MSNIYILIVVGFFSSESTNDFKLPYYEIISSHYTNESCNKEIVRTHDYYLAKDIRKKKNKQREPKFIYDENKNKILAYKNNGINYFASCKVISFKK